MAEEPTRLVITSSQEGCRVIVLFLGQREIAEVESEKGDV